MANTSKDFEEIVTLKLDPGVGLKNELENPSMFLPIEIAFSHSQHRHFPTFDSFPFKR